MNDNSITLIQTDEPQPNYTRNVAITIVTVICFIGVVLALILAAQDNAKVERGNNNACPIMVSYQLNGSPADQAQGWDYVARTGCSLENWNPKP